MRIISLDSVTGNERLAKDLINSTESVLITAGTVLKKEYVERLKELDIEYIYVEDDISKGINLSDSLELQIKEQCQETFRDILQKYAYHNSSELEKIKILADEIIHEILQKPEVIFNLSCIREKDSSTYSHSLNVCVLSVIIAYKMRVKKDKIKDIAIGCLLHDLGFIYSPINYQDLKIETCSEKELKEIKKHTIYGYTVVESLKWLSNTAKDIILNHHERLNGTGYPFRLTGNKIRIGSKIAAVCDEFDSKVYGYLTKKIKVHEAIEYIVSQAGVLFDFVIVKAFIDSVAAYPTGSIVTTNQGETGIVLRQNPKCPTRPVIRIIRDSKGNITNEWIEKDLTKELTLFITDTIMN